MPIRCRFFENRIVPVSFEKNEEFNKPLDRESLQLILVENGCAALRMNQERFFLQAGALIFRNSKTKITKLFSRSMEAKSISFSPEFINVNLSSNHIMDDEYAEISFLYGYPSFHLFYDWSNSYAGVLPLSPLVQPKACELFSAAINELDSQPDYQWSCRARVNILELFQLAEEEYTHFICGEVLASPLASKVLEYIHVHYDQEISVEMLCEMYNTNHTTLLRDFRRLTGTTIGQYILEYRLLLAKEALLFTSLSVEEIALKFGFRQAAYLSRVFKERIGMPPGQFRNHMVQLRKNAYGGFKNEKNTHDQDEDTAELMK